jgi:hypothetical protein
VVTLTKGPRPPPLLHLASNRGGPQQPSSELRWRWAGLLMLSRGVFPRLGELVPSTSTSRQAAVAFTSVLAVVPLAMAGFQAVRVVTTTKSWRSRLPATATRACASVSG